MVNDDDELRQTVRIAISLDAASVAELRWLWAQETDPDVGPWQSDSAFISAVESWLDEGHRTVWTAQQSNQIIGMACLTEYTRMPSPRTDASGRWGYLGHLYVRPKYRSAGIGQDLISAVLETGDARGYSKTVLSPSEQSIPFYARSGFNLHNNLMIRRTPTVAMR